MGTNKIKLFTDVRSHILESVRNAVCICYYR